MATATKERKKKSDSQKPPRLKDPKTGQFLPGNDARARATPKMPCPAWMKAQGLEQLWRELVKKARTGDVSAAKQLVAWAEKREANETIGAEIQSRASEYDGLPDDVCDLLDELGTGLGNIIERAEAGLPLSDIETLVYKFSSRFIRGEKRHRSMERMRGAIKDILAQVRADVAIDAGDETEKETDSNEQKQEPIRTAEQAKA